MVENITNITTVTPPISFWDFLAQLPNLTVAQLFGMLDTSILLIAFFDFDNVAEKWKFSLFLSFIGGLAYNFLVQALPRHDVVTHALLLGSTFIFGVMIKLIRTGKL
jgi:hypothetical protein